MLFLEYFGSFCNVFRNCCSMCLTMTVFFLICFWWGSVHVLPSLETFCSLWCFSRWLHMSLHLVLFSLDVTEFVTANTVVDVLDTVVDLLWLNDDLLLLTECNAEWANIDWCLKNTLVTLPQSFRVLQFFQTMWLNVMRVGMIVVASQWECFGICSGWGCRWNSQSH
jgi:hypothetical protein